MKETQFEFSGGNVALDFANTVDGTRRSPTEHLHEYADLVSWAEEAGLIGTSRGKRLREIAKDHPRDAALIFRRAIDLREAVFRIFDHRIKGRGVDPADVARLDSESRDAMRNQTLTRTADGRFVRSWPSDDRLELPVWQVAVAATDLLLSNMNVIKQCASQTCDWLFVDQSRNKSRRWCDMKDCGNRAKVRRYHAKLRAGRSPTRSSPRVVRP